MKRIIKVLVVTALMVVLMATTVSPAFAARNCDKTYGWGCDQYLQNQGDGQGSGTGYGNQTENNVLTCPNGGHGWGCKDKDNNS